MIKWGALVVSIQPYQELIQLARYLEASGFSSFWYPDEKYYRECYIGLTLAATNTSTIRLGPCVTDPYLRHPILTAVSIGSLAEVAQGRVCLGIGAGGRGLSEVGIKAQRPAVALREAIEIIRALLEGKSVSYSGEIISLQERQLDFIPPSDIPIMIGTGHGKLIQQLAGEMADIAMLANFTTPETISSGLRNIETGASKSKRTLADLEIISRVDVAVSDDPFEARKAVAPRILSAIRSSYPDLSYFDALPGFDLSSKFIQVLKKKDYQTKSFYAIPENSYRLIPPMLTDHMAIAGTPDQVASRLRDISNMNVFREITISPVMCSNQSLFDAFQLLVDRVFPLV